MIDDWGNHRILILSPTGQTIRTFDAIQNEPLKLATTSGALAGPDGHIYVADYQLYRVQEFDSQVDRSGDLYSADGLSVVKYSREGKLLMRWR